MKAKKLLSAIIAATMALTTVSFSAFAENDVAQIGETPYDTLAAAVAAAQSGDTITLLSDIALADSTITIATDDNIILDLAGYTISGTSSESKSHAMIQNNGILTITGNGKVTYQYTGDADTTFGFGNYTISNSGKLTVKSGTIENTTALSNHMSDAIDNNSINSNAELTIDDGKIFSTNYIAIRQISSSASTTNNITVNYGIIDGYFRAIWVQLAGSDTTVAPKVELNINGGEFFSRDNGSNGYYMAVYSYSYGNSFENTKISVTNGTFNGDIAVTGGPNKTVNEQVDISGGIFDKYGFYSYKEDYNVDRINVTGGTYAKKDYVSEYIADGYAAVANSDGTYSVKPIATAPITVLKELLTKNGYTVQDDTYARGEQITMPSVSGNTLNAKYVFTKDSTTKDYTFSFDISKLEIAGSANLGILIYNIPTAYTVADPVITVE